MLSNSLLQAPIQTHSEGLSVLYRYGGNVVSACTWLSTHRFFILLLLLCLGFLVSSYNVSDLMLDLSLRHFYFSFAAPCDIKQTQLPNIWLKKSRIQSFVNHVHETNLTSVFLCFIYISKQPHQRQIWAECFRAGRLVVFLRYTLNLSASPQNWINPVRRSDLEGWAPKEAAAYIGRRDLHALYSIYITFPGL